MSNHRRRSKHLPASNNWVHRGGGRVTLSNFTCGVSGSAIGVKRFKYLHRRGYVGKGCYSTSKKVTDISAKPKNPSLEGGPANDGAGTIVPQGNINYGGLGATKRTSMHSSNERRQKLQEEIDKQLNKKMCKPSSSNSQEHKYKEE